jgi:hypothetical protein
MLSADQVPVNFPHLAAHHNLQCDPSIDVAHGLKADISPTFADVRIRPRN